MHLKLLNVLDRENEAFFPSVTFIIYKKKTFSFSFCKPSFHFYLLTPNICTFPLLSQEKNISEKMDRLPNELLTTVIKAKHRKLANKKATFRVLPKDYLRYMADDSPCATIHRFMQKANLQRP